MKKIFFILCFGFLILLVNESSQAQCSCKTSISELTTPATHPFSEEFKKSATVFIGRVTKIKKKNILEQQNSKLVGLGNRIHQIILQ